MSDRRRVESLIALTLGIAVVAIVRRYLEERQRERLLANPPTRTVMELALPFGTADSTERAAQVLRKLAGLCSPDATMRREGRGAIEVLFLAEHAPGQAQPVLRTFVLCDRDDARPVKRLLKGAYENVLEIRPAEGDPLRRFLP